MATPLPVNHTEFTLGEVARATGGVVAAGNEALVLKGVSTDTRTLEPGALFVALVGEKHDGHAHLAAAAAAGAAAAVVRRGTRAQMPSVQVDDTLDALGRLARHHVARTRECSPALPLLAITGSAGKTTTKELSAALARALFGETLATRGNLNNLVGVPMMLLALERAHRAIVLECGTSARGEIARLGAIANPDVALVLNADAGHTQGIGSVDDVAIEKGALFSCARRVAIGNADDPPSFAQLSRARCVRRSFGESDRAEVRLRSRELLPGGRARVRIELAPAMVMPGVEPLVVADIQLLGHAAALDAAAALAAVASMRDGPLSADDLANMATALESVAPTSGRLSPREIHGSVLVIDDSYNANPRSVVASLEAARELARARGGRLLVVLGDMLELGDLSRVKHEEVGGRVVAAGASLFVAAGAQMAYAARAAIREGGATVVVETPCADDAAIAVESMLRPGDVVLVKGSRGMRMERVVEALATRERGTAS